MSNFTEWAEGKVESFNSQEILSLHQVKEEIYTQYCTVCEKQCDGLPCGETECPNDPPLFI